MEHDREVAHSDEETAKHPKGLHLLLGAGIGYVIGKVALKKPLLGALLGAGLVWIVGSESEEES